MIEKISLGQMEQKIQQALSIESDLPVPVLYNHDIMNCTAEGISGNEFYSARALGLTEAEDIIQLSPHLKPEWPAICRHYDRIGLSHTNRVIWSTSLEQVALHSEYTPSLFFFGENEHNAVKDQRWADVVNYTNSKNNFIKLAQQLGVPVPKTRCFNRADEITQEVANTTIFPCYLKAAVSVSGVGIYRAETAKALLVAANTFATDTPVQIQEEVLSNCFLNMQYQVVNSEPHRLLTTEQILEGTAHQGNIYPARAEPWEVVEPIAVWMTQQGFRDLFAFDVAVVEEQGKPNRYLVIECNPRYNGASYPTAIALKLDIHQWEVRYFKTWHTSLVNIDLSGIEYNSQSGEGVILVNWGPILVGKLMFMLAGTEEVRGKLEVDLTHRLW
jgi:hypothetical protein